MFIELSTRVFGIRAGECKWRRTLLRADSIILIREEVDNDRTTVVVLSSGEEYLFEESLDEVFTRIQKAEAPSGSGYTVTLAEGTGFTTTTMVPNP